MKKIVQSIDKSNLLLEKSELLSLHKCPSNWQTDKKMQNLQSPFEKKKNHQFMSEEIKVQDSKLNPEISGFTEKNQTSGHRNEISKDNLEIPIKKMEILSPQSKNNICNEQEMLKENKNVFKNKYFQFIY